MRPQQGKVARLICDVYRKDGTPYEGDPRYVLRKAVAEAEEMGYSMNVGPECEFFLFHTDEDGLPTTVTHEEGGYFDIGPLDLGENARRDMILTLAEMGFEIISSHHEIAPAQHEIDFHYDEAMVTADNLMTFKMVVKTIAKRHGLHATFMPKPKSATYGSGMHINLSLYGRDGMNVLYNAEDVNGLSEEGYYFIGGLMKHMKAITCITNPTVNSYKRFVPGYEAPVYMGWSAKTRGPLIRVSADKERKSRLELRSPDATANPYLALAVLLKAGLDGIKNKIMPPANIDENIQKMTQERRDELHVEELPRNLGDATAELEKDQFLIDVLGGELAKKIIKANKKEYKEYCMQVTDWEIAHYLHRL